MHFRSQEQKTLSRSHTLPTGVVRLREPVLLSLGRVLQSIETTGQSARRLVLSATASLRKRLHARACELSGTSFYVIAGATPRGPTLALVWRGGGGGSGSEDASGGDGGQRLQFQKAAGSVREPGA